MNWLILSIILTQGIDSEILEKKSLEAREILKQEKVSFRRASKSSNSRIVSRDIVLATYSQFQNSIKVVRLEVVVPKSLNNSSFNFKVVTSGLDVERIAGKGIIRLEFKVVDKSTKEELL